MTDSLADRAPCLMRMEGFNPGDKCKCWCCEAAAALREPSDNEIRLINRNGELNQCIAELERERDVLAEATAELAEANSDLEDLRPYVQHTPECVRTLGRRGCTCGLDEICAS